MAKVLNHLLLLGALIAFSSCASKGHWRHAHLNTGTEFSSSKVAYVLPDSHRNIELEILRTKDSCKGYLSVHSHPIVSTPTDPKKAVVSLRIQQDSFSFLAIRHEGGHRLVLPEEILEKILLALSQNHEVLVETSGYKTSISPQGFSSTYAKFKSPSKIPSLIQLPL